MTRTSLFRVYSESDIHAHTDDRVTFHRLSELLELRRLRKARRGIDVVKLSSGDAKKRRRRHAEEAPEDKGGLRAGVGSAERFGEGEGRGSAAGAGANASTEDE